MSEHSQKYYSIYYWADSSGWISPNLRSCNESCTRHVCLGFSYASASIIGSLLPIVNNFKIKKVQTQMSVYGNEGYRFESCWACLPDNDLHKSTIAPRPAFIDG